MIERNCFLSFKQAICLKRQPMCLAQFLGHQYWCLRSKKWKSWEFSTKKIQVELRSEAAKALAFQADFSLCEVMKPASYELKCRTLS